MRNSIAIRSLAHGRAGDKSDILNISVVAKDSADFEYLVAHVTETHCAEVFAFRGQARVTRYILPNLRAMNFVIEGILDGGVNLSLYPDRHGKCLSSLLLDSRIPAPGSASAEVLSTSEDVR